jgi:hypothetical protein
MVRSIGQPKALLKDFIEKVVFKLVPIYIYIILVFKG